ncbi:MAG: hypothetical protein HY267_07260, partial [Deltaproteobacteria bacterium]|nr:hypothetical protein [Deltaproteobacteria bacterium]
MTNKREKAGEGEKAASEQKGVMRLGEAADIGIGYVTGCNDYFHLGPAEAESWGIPTSYLKPAV